METVTDGIFKIYHRGRVYENSSVLKLLRKEDRHDKKKSVLTYGAAVFLKHIIFCHT